MTSSTSLENMRLESPRSENLLDWVRANRQKQRDEKFLPPSLSDMVDALIASLEGADKVVGDKVEALLTRIGRPAIPALIQGLKSPHSRVKSVCAMTLVRIGQPCIEDLRKFYLRHAAQDDLRWVIEFIFNELGNQSLPTLKKDRYYPGVHQPVAERKVLPFSKVVSV